MTDFIVIGGGVAGLSAGARLSEHGRVLLFESEPAFGYHASGRSAALWEPSYGNAAVKALSRASEDYYRSAGDGGYLTPRGFLLLGAETEHAAFDEDLAGIGCDEITPAEAAAMVPILNTNHIARVAYHPTPEDIDTDRLLQDFVRIIRSNGGELRSGAAVSAITRTPDGWEVTAGGQTATAKVLVNAAGPWADRIAVMAGLDPIGLIPYRRSMARIAAPGGHDVSRWPMFFGAGETWYAKPDAGQLIVSPADEDPMDPMDAWPDDIVLAEGFAKYQDFVTEEVTRPTAIWAGLRTFAPDHTLVLGPDPTDARVRLVRRTGRIRLPDRTGRVGARRSVGRRECAGPAAGHRGRVVAGAFQVSPVRRALLREPQIRDPIAPRYTVAQPPRAKVPQ